jgi:hypothetical protein
LPLTATTQPKQLSKRAWNGVSFRMARPGDYPRPRRAITVITLSQLCVKALKRNFTT